ncbi:Acetolactate synthase isozyme 3 large subunit [Candidatus Tremblaya princeps]|uniref:Acetolactate synthase isozyme 3 large subunit n=1 Tax=Tremblaya princeps TaxID=189385 RepID=A0A143WNS8_TREPR|nr:Acetolactate synthase isozyme 3 large subunit [Candidatus Tremblaya princeps]
MRRVWGYPGGSVLWLYDELYGSGLLRHMPVRCEQAAAHAASASYAASRELGACLVTSGPGITNAITGIATAHADSVPVLAISGQVPLAGMGRGSFQECDAVILAEPCTKGCYGIRSLMDIIKATWESCIIARTNRPSPVLLDFPKDISKFTMAFHLTELRYRQNQIPAQTCIPCWYVHVHMAVRQISTAARPLAYAGGGSAPCAHRLACIAGAAGLPMIGSLMGLDAMSTRRSMGMAGMYGRLGANLALQYCDLVVAMGARFDDRVVTSPARLAWPGRTLVAVNVESSLTRDVDVSHLAMGRVEHFLCLLCRMLSKYGVLGDQAMRPWRSLLRSWRLLQRHGRAGYAMYGNLFIRATMSSCALCCDVGQHQMWVAQHHTPGRQVRRVNSGGLGTMGCGIPFAMGAQALSQGLCAVCVTGDGSVQMSMQELPTMRAMGARVIVLVLNNGSLGMVRQWQQVEHSGRYSQSASAPCDGAAAIAEQHGHVGVDLHGSAHASAAFAESRSSVRHTTLLNVPHSSHECVWPMVQGGRSITNMMTSHRDIN